jgi:predicted phosphodiesterase
MVRDCGSIHGTVRVAIVSDVHGNRRAFEAVLGDLRQVAPDLILHGGDLAYGGAHPAEIIEYGKRQPIP